MEDVASQGLTPADIDTMRIEFQDVSPKEKRKISEKASDIVTSLEELYGKHLSEDKLGLLKTISERILIVDESVIKLYKRNAVENPLKRFFYNLNMDIREKVFGGVSFGLYEKDKNVVFLLSPNNFKIHLDKIPNLIAHFSRAGGGVNEDRDRAIEYLMVSTLVHELMHIIGRHEAPDLFKELATEYYQKTILNKLYPEQRIVNERMVDTSLYVDAIGKFGEEFMMNAFFDDGSKTSDEQLKVMFVCDRAVRKQGGIY